MRLRTSLVGKLEVRWAFYVGSPSNFDSDALAKLLRKEDGVTSIAESRRIRTISSELWEAKEIHCFQVTVDAHKKAWRQGASYP